MSEKMKVWTCKLPAESDLKDRLRKSSKQANLHYYELLEKMLDLWDKHQAENSFQSDDLNVRINKIEKFMYFVANDAHLEWDSKNEKWIIPVE